MAKRSAATSNYKTARIDRDELNALRDAIADDDANLAPFRERRRELIKEYAGSHYGPAPLDQRRAMNMIELAVSTLMQNMAGSTPQTGISTPIPELRFQAETFEQAVNNLAVAIDLETSLEEITYDSAFGPGIAMIGLTAAEPEMRGDSPTALAGRLFVDPVTLDDYIYDTKARRAAQCQYRGNRFLVDMEWLVEESGYDGAALRVADELYNRYTNIDGGQRAESVSVQGDSGRNYRPQCELVNIWIPSKQLLVTDYAQSGAEVPLRAIRWTGPAHGPYRSVAYHRVPSQMQPLPPAQILYELHLLANGLLNKAAYQALRQKKVGVFDGTEDEARRMSEAADGEYIHVENAGTAKEIASGGTDPRLIALIMQVFQMGSRQAGNLEAMGGLGAQADTLGQERLITSNAARRIVYMQKQMARFYRDVFRDIGWYAWYDRHFDPKLAARVPGTDWEVPVSFAASDRRGDFLDFNFTFDPYGMAIRSPDEKASELISILTGLVVPLAPQLQAEGRQINVGAALEQLAKWKNMPILREIIGSADPANALAQAAGGSERPRQSPVTRRENVRINSGGGGGNGQSAMMAQLLSGGGEN